MPCCCVEHPFSSNLGCWFWRVSSIVVVDIPTYIVVGCFVLNGEWRWPNYRFRPWISLQFVWHWGRGMSKIITQSLLLVSLIVVSCGRLLLLVESFLSLRSVPEGSFKTTVWDDYWPHLWCRDVMVSYFSTFLYHVQFNFKAGYKLARYGEISCRLRATSISEGWLKMTSR